MKYLKKGDRLIAALLCVLIITQSMPQLVIATEIVQSDAQDAEETSVSEEEATVVSSTEDENSVPGSSTETDVTVEGNTEETGKAISDETPEDVLTEESLDDVDLLAEEAGTVATETKKKVKLDVACEEEEEIQVKIQDGEGKEVLKNTKLANTKEASTTEIELNSKNNYKIYITELDPGVKFTGLTCGGKTVGSVKDNIITITGEDVEGLSGDTLIFQLEYQYKIQIQKTAEDIVINGIQATVTKGVNIGDGNYTEENLDVTLNEENLSALKMTMDDAEQLRISVDDLHGLKIEKAVCEKIGGTAEDVMELEVNASDNSAVVSFDSKQISALKEADYVIRLQVSALDKIRIDFKSASGFDAKTVLNEKYGTVSYDTIEGEDKALRILNITCKDGYYIKNDQGAYYERKADVYQKDSNSSINIVQISSFEMKKTNIFLDNFFRDGHIELEIGRDIEAPSVEVDVTRTTEGKETPVQIEDTDGNIDVYRNSNSNLNVHLTSSDGDGIGMPSMPIKYERNNGTSGELSAKDTLKLEDVEDGTQVTFYVRDRLQNVTKRVVRIHVDKNAPVIVRDNDTKKIEVKNINVGARKDEPSYWYDSSDGSPYLTFHVSEENAKVTASYLFREVDEDGNVGNVIGAEKTCELIVDEEATKNLDTTDKNEKVYRMDLDFTKAFGDKAKTISSLPDGTYAICTSLNDITERNKTEEVELVRFTVNNSVPTIQLGENTKQLQWVNSSVKNETVYADMEIRSYGDDDAKYYYAVTAVTGDAVNSKNKGEPEKEDWEEIPAEKIETDAIEGVQRVKNLEYQLPIKKYRELEGTVKFYLWVRVVRNSFKGDATSEPIVYNIDNTQPNIESVEVSEKLSVPNRIYRYVFGTTLNEKESLSFTIKTTDLAQPGAVYASSEYNGDDQPDVKDVSLYYIAADDSELAEMTVGEQYKWLRKNDVKWEKLGATKKKDGTYNIKLDIQENDKFYKLYIVAIDKSGNVMVKSVASMTGDSDNYNISQIMVDDKKPEIVTSVQENTKADYTEKRDGKEYNWYAASSAINYDVTVKDAQSGIFSVEAQVNGSTLKKDANGTKFYDSNSYYQKNKADKMKLETKFTYVVNLKQGNLGKDGQSTIQIDVADNAGNTNSVKNVVYVDENAPVISYMEFDTGAKDDLSTVPTQYGYFFQKATTVTVYATDYIGDSDIIGSGVAKIGYQLNPADGSEPISGELEATANADGTYTAQFAIPEGFKGQIEVKAIDHVGQDSGFYNPKGAVVETAEEHVATSDAKILLPETEYADAEGNPLYASDVTLQLVTADGRSGLKENNWSVKEHYAADALAGGMLQVTSVFDEASRTWSSVCDGDADWSIPNALDLNLVTSAQKNVVVASDTNHIEAALQITDNAGNVSGAEGKTFSIDKTAPVVTVEYDNNNVLNEKYYKEKRTATITVVDANFSEENCTFDITGPNANVSGWTHHAAAGCDGTVHTAECYYTCQVEFVEDGDYKFDFHCTDRAGHTAGMQAPDEFTIDTAVPVISVSYDNNAGNANYYSEARTATIEINDKNFNPATTQVDVTASLEGNGISVPQPSAFTQNGDVWTASVNFSTDGDYSLHVTSTDQAGNEAEEYALDEFTVDTTVPEVTISGVEDHSANQGTVAPTIQCSDINMNTDSISVTLTGANNGATAFESSRTVTGSEATISIADIQHTEEMDDLYTLEVSVQDQAGNETVESVLFSVNRFGSVYVVDDKTKTLVDNFYTNQEQDVIITEVNVDILQYSEIDYSLDGDIVTLEKDKDYTVTSKTDEASWKMYEYCIDKSNFEKEGSYVVSVYSEDLAQNKSSNKAKGEELAFVVDKTAPTIVIAGVEDNGQYMDAKRNVTIDTQDNILLDNVEVYVGDTKKAAAGQDELLESDGQISLGIDGANKSQELYVVAKDAAGNIAKSENIRFLITKNVLVQWYSNVPLCVGSSTAAVGITGLVVFRKRIPFRNLKHVVKGRK